MTVLNDADAIYIGTAAASAVYVGTEKVWPKTAAPFDPNSIPGLALWFAADGQLWQDAARTVPVAADAAVAAWDDASPSMMHATQSDPARRPIYKPGVLNARPVVRFQGDNVATSVMPLNQPVTLVYVFAQRSTAAQTVVFDGTSNYYDAVYIDGPTNKQAIYAGAVLVGQLVVTNVAFVGAALSSEVSSKIWKGGGPGIAGNVGGRHPSGLSIGASPSGSDPTHCDVAEVLAYRRALTAGELDQVAGYLATKYALAWSPAS